MNTTLATRLAKLEQAVADLRIGLDADSTPTPNVGTSSELTAALARGGNYTLAPGLYVGNYVIDKPTTLTGPRDARLVPLDLLMPTLIMTASTVRADGFAVSNGAPDRECVVVGQSDARTVLAQPSDVRLTRLLVEAGIHGGHRGMALHGSNITVRGCDVLNFWEAGRDSQAIWINNGPGPYTIENNYLEASGGTILVGGGPLPLPPCLPHEH